MKDLLNRTIKANDTVFYLTTKEIDTVASISLPKHNRPPCLYLTKNSYIRVRPTSLIVINQQLASNKQDYPENFI